MVIVAAMGWESPPGCGRRVRANDYEAKPLWGFQEMEKFGLMGGISIRVWGARTSA